MKYSDLIEFATVRQIEYIEAVEKYGSQDKAAKVTREREVFSV